MPPFFTSYVFQGGVDSVASCRPKHRLCSTVFTTCTGGKSNCLGEKNQGALFPTDFAYEKKTWEERQQKPNTLTSRVYYYFFFGKAGVGEKPWVAAVFLGVVFWVFITRCFKWQDSRPFLIRQYWFNMFTSWSFGFSKGCAPLQGNDG